MLLFSISKLFGTHNLEVDLSERCVIIIGENGVGKTTVLKILRCIASGHYVGLTQFPFEALTLRNNDTTLQISYQELFPDPSALEQLLQHFSSQDEGMSLIKYLGISHSNVKRIEAESSWGKVTDVLKQIDSSKYYDMNEYYRLLSASYWNYDIDPWFHLNKEEQYISKKQLKKLLEELNYDKCFMLSPISLNSKYKKLTNDIQCLLGLKFGSNNETKLSATQRLSREIYPVYLYNSLDSYIIKNDHIRYKISEPSLASNGRLHHMDWFNPVNDKDDIAEVAAAHRDILNFGIGPDEQLINDIENALKQKEFPLNAIIADSYFSIDEIVDLNKRVADYIEKLQDREFVEDDYMNLDYQEFFIVNRKDIERYILPYLFSNSVFFNVIERAFHEIDDDDSVTYYPELYAIAFKQYFEENIEALRHSSSRKIQIYELLLNNFLFNKRITVCPSGLIIHNAAGEELDVSLLSSGEKKILALLTIAAFFDNSILMIDEPEVSLSLVWQSWLVPELLKLIESKLIIATHSPYIAEDEGVHKYVQPIYIELVGNEHDK